jgi:hypothetical protein
MPEHLS